MLRLVYDGGYWDYTKWRITTDNLFLFDNSMKISQILWLSDTVSIVDETKILVNAKNNTEESIGIELFYGGVIND
jgi:hypothetical protein